MKWLLFPFLLLAAGCLYPVLTIETLDLQPDRVQRVLVVDRNPFGETVYQGQILQDDVLTTVTRSKNTIGSLGGGTIGALGAWMLKP